MPYVLQFHSPVLSAPAVSSVPTYSAVTCETPSLVMAVFVCAPVPALKVSTGPVPAVITSPTCEDCFTLEPEDDLHIT